MMRKATGPMRLVLLLPALGACFVGSSATARCEPTRARAFLEANGLEAYNGRCIDYLVCVIRNEPEKAAEIHIGSVNPGADENTKQGIRRMTTQAAALLTRAAVSEIELVAAHRVSSKAVALCYVLNTDHGPILFAFGAYRHKDRWYSYSWDLRTEFREIREHLRGTIRFDEPAAFAVEPVKEKSV